MKCKNPTCSGTMRFLHEHFTRFVIPDTIMSDNGASFTATDCKDFCRVFLIVRIITTPYNFQSNEKVGKFVDTFKLTLKKSNGNESVDDILQF